MNKFASPAWQEWVLSLLEPNEGFEIDLGNSKRFCPRTVGLIRATQREIGNVTFTYVHLDKASSNDDVAATVSTVVEIEVYPELLEVWSRLPEVLTAPGIADCGLMNTQPDFACYAAATAHTRAMGRAIKQSLFLDVLMSDEVSGKIDTSGLASPKSGCASSTKTKAMVNLAKALGISDKFFMDRLGVPSLTVEGSTDIPLGTAQDILEELNGFQNGNVPKEYVA